MKLCHGLILMVVDSNMDLNRTISCTQVPLPEKPDTEDETLLKNWKWHLRSVKKENSERHSQRCDVELKLAVRD